MTQVIHFNENWTFLHPFFGKTVVFTGALTTMTRTMAARLAINCGARVHGTVTEHTDFVILGNKRRGVSTKLQRAKRLIADGADMQLITEDDFLWILAIEKGPASP